MNPGVLSTLGVYTALNWFKTHSKWLGTKRPTT